MRRAGTVLCCPGLLSTLARLAPRCPLCEVDHSCAMVEGTGPVVEHCAMAGIAAPTTSLVVSPLRSYAVVQAGLLLTPGVIAVA